MFKKALFGLAFCAALAACGGEPPADEVGVATEALHIALGPYVNLNTGLPGPGNFGEQVPFGTSRTLHVNDGTYPKFGMTNGSVIGSLSNSLVQGRESVDWVMQFHPAGPTGTGPVPYGSQNLECPQMELTGLTATTGQAAYFPWAPLHVDGGYFIAKQTGFNAGNCLLRGYPEYPPVRPGLVMLAFDHAGTPNAFRYPEGWNDPTYAPGALREIYMRIDLDFPVQGVTNRYFYDLPILVR